MLSVVKCLSVRPPYSDWIVQAKKFQKHGIPVKNVENRDWATNYRGPLLIHASQTFQKSALEWFAGFDLPEGVISFDPKDYIKGAIIGICNLVDCLHEDDYTEKVFLREEEYNPWFCGPFGFILENARALQQPIPCKGQLGLFNVPVSLLSDEVKDFVQEMLINA